jgi:hypothetical protein
MAGTVRLNPKIVNFKSVAIEYFEGMALEPVKDGFPFTGNNNVMTKFINHRAILQEALRLPSELLGILSLPSVLKSSIRVPRAAAKLGVPASTLESKIRSLKINKYRFKEV